MPRFAKVCGWLDSFMSDMAVKLFCICQDEQKFYLSAGILLSKISYNDFLIEQIRTNLVLVLTMLSYAKEH